MSEEMTAPWPLERYTKKMTGETAKEKKSPETDPFDWTREKLHGKTARPTVAPPLDILSDKEDDRNVGIQAVLLPNGDWINASQIKEVFLKDKELGPSGIQYLSRVIVRSAGHYAATYQFEKRDDAVKARALIVLQLLTLCENVPFRQWETVEDFDSTVVAEMPHGERL